MAEQYLHRAQVTCLLIDDRCLGSAKRIRPVVLPAQSDPGDPLINEPIILPSADMIGMIDPAWKDEVVERAAAAFEPCQNTAASGFEEFELNGSTGLLLNETLRRLSASLLAARPSIKAWNTRCIQLQQYHYYFLSGRALHIYTGTAGIFVRHFEFLCRDGPQDFRLV